MNQNLAKIKHLGIKPYSEVLTLMEEFTENRTQDSEDEFWILEHEPVFTLGLAANPGHLLFTNHNIPIIKTNRGGQVTYHAPGQIIIYTLVDLKRLDLSVRTLVTKLEQGIINFLLEWYNIESCSQEKAPGVYVNNNKIASLGLKIRKGCSYHGISFNVNMDLTPFSYINVCGYPNLKVTQLKELINLPQSFNLQELGNNLASSIVKQIYN